MVEKQRDVRYVETSPGVFGNRLSAAYRIARMNESAIIVVRLRRKKPLKLWVRAQGVRLLPSELPPANHVHVRRDHQRWPPLKRRKRFNMMLDDQKQVAESITQQDTEENSDAGPVDDDVSAQFLTHIASDAFPCVGAKAALARDAIQTHEFGSIVDARSDADLLDAIRAFGAMLGNRDPDDSTVYSLVAIFSDNQLVAEEVFEKQLWALLQRLHHIDAREGVPWAQAISTNPQSPKFSLSLGGTPFFIIGLHPNSSRLGRRFPRPVMVFNSHEQFEELREDGRYQKMQKATRTRDEELQGSINPNLADFGAASEARQYSGRKVGPEWKCPFRVEVV